MPLHEKCNALLRRVPTPCGDDIAVHDFGGDGPSLILLHANGFHGLVFQPLVSAACCMASERMLVPRDTMHMHNSHL